MWPRLERVDMDAWKPTALLACLVVALLVGWGGGALSGNYVLAVAEESLYDPTLAAIAIVVGSVAALIGLGVGFRRHSENPYW